MFEYQRRPSTQQEQMTLEQAHLKPRKGQLRWERRERAQNPEPKAHRRRSAQAGQPRLSAGRPLQPPEQPLAEQPIVRSSTGCSNQLRRRTSVAIQNLIEIKVAKPMRHSYQHPVAATEAGSHHRARQELRLERPTGTVRGRQDSPMRPAGSRGNQER